MSPSLEPKQGLWSLGIQKYTLTSCSEHSRCYDTWVVVLKWEVEGDTVKSCWNSLPGQEKIQDSLNWKRGP